MLLATPRGTESATTKLRVVLTRQQERLAGTVSMT